MLLDWQRQKNGEENLERAVTQEDSGTEHAHLGCTLAIDLQGIQGGGWKDHMLVWNFIMIDFDAEAWFGRHGHGIAVLRSTLVK